MDIFLSEMPQWRRNKRQFGAAQCLTLGGKEMVLLRLINNPEVIGSLGRLGLLEVASQCDVELGRDYVLEQWNLVSSWLVIEYWEVLMCMYCLDFVLANTN